MADNHRVIIIGSGPAGLTAAIYAARAGLNPLVAAGATPGGQLTMTTEVENFPGFPQGISGPELMLLFQQQAQRFGAKIINASASRFAKLDSGLFDVEIDRNIYRTEAIIIATGSTAKWLNLPNEQRYINNGISACATCDGPLPAFRNKPMIVVGGGDTAAEEALFLSKFGSSITMLVRGHQLRASRIMQQRLRSNPKIIILYNASVVEYLGDQHLESVRVRIVKDDLTQQEQLIPAAALFIAIGHSPATDNFPGLNLDEHGYIVVNNHINTNIPGVFAAGDVHDRHYRQAITASGFGCMAALAAERWLSE